jgi:hypothetical protein
MAVFIAILCPLAGCASPTVVMTTEGLSDQVPNAAANGQYAILKAAFGAAQSRALGIATAPAQAANAYQPPASDQAIYQEFALVGMATIDDNCSDFFTNAGEHEKLINFGKDLITTGGTITAGALALAGASKEAVSIAAFSVVAINDGFDIYTRNFLFGAGNIDSVRTLILNALDGHHTAVLKDPTTWTFNNAMRVVLDHQEICRPSSIVALVKAAIKTGHITAAQQTQSALPAAAPAPFAVVPAPAPPPPGFFTPGTKHYSVGVQ